MYEQWSERYNTCVCLCVCVCVCACVRVCVCLCMHTADNLSNQSRLLAALVGYVTSFIEKGLQPHEWTGTLTPHLMVASGKQRHGAESAVTFSPRYKPKATHFSLHYKAAISMFFVHWARIHLPSHRPPPNRGKSLWIWAQAFYHGLNPHHT
jgi:hypothetical protein